MHFKKQIQIYQVTSWHYKFWKVWLKHFWSFFRKSWRLNLECFKIWKNYEFFKRDPAHLQNLTYKNKDWTLPERSMSISTDSKALRKRRNYTKLNSKASINLVVEQNALERNAENFKTNLIRLWYKHQDTELEVKAILDWG